MARTILKSTLGLLSAAVFFAAFTLVGDVVIAATVAIAVGISQLVLGFTSHRGVNALTWASLALVIAITGLTLMGEDTVAVAGPVTRPAAHISKMSLDCGCQPSKAEGLTQRSSGKDVNL